MATIYHVKNPNTGEDFFFESFALVEKSIGITWSSVPQDKKPAIHKTGIGEWCVGDIDSPSLIIIALEHGHIRKEACHL